MPLFAPGALKTARAGITIKPAGLNCVAELYLGAKVVTSGLQPFTSTGGAQDITFPVTMPSTQGTYPVYLDVFVAGQLVGTYQAIEDVVIAPILLYPSWVESYRIIFDPILLKNVAYVRDDSLYGPPGGNNLLGPPDGKYTFVWGGTLPAWGGYGDPDVYITVGLSQTITANRITLYLRNLYTFQLPLRPPVSYAVPNTLRVSISADGINWAIVGIPGPDIPPGTSTWVIDFPDALVTFIKVTQVFPQDVMYVNQEIDAIAVSRV